jgi:hypothetical protein
LPISAVLHFRARLLISSALIAGDNMGKVIQAANIKAE